MSWCRLKISFRRRLSLELEVSERRLYVEKLWPGAQVKLIRGNVETRLAKLAKGEYDGIILAKAGLDRLGIIERKKKHFVFQPLDPEVFPSCGVSGNYCRRRQGGLGVSGNGGEAQPQENTPVL